MISNLRVTLYDCIDSISAPLEHTATLFSYSFWQTFWWFICQHNQVQISNFKKSQNFSSNIFCLWCSSSTSARTVTRLTVYRALYSRKKFFEILKIFVISKLRVTLYDFRDSISAPLEHVDGLKLYWFGRASGWNTFQHKGSKSLISSKSENLPWNPS